MCKNIMETYEKNCSIRTLQRQPHATMLTCMARMMCRGPFQVHLFFSDTQLFLDDPIVKGCELTISVLRLGS